MHKFAADRIGRGRALAVVPREQITEEAISEVCRFLVGPCSCVVKARNPGFDILLPVDCDRLVAGTIGADEDLPPLSVPAIGPPEKMAAAATTSTTRGVAERSVPTGPTGGGDHVNEAAKPSGLTRNLILMASVALLGLLAATVALVARRKGGGSRTRVDAQ